MNARSTTAGAPSSPRVPARTAPAAAKQGPARKSFRSTAIVALVVPGLFATVALPAYAVAPDATTTEATHSYAEQSAQTLVVSSAAQTLTVSRDAYGATTPEEIAAKKAAEEAKKAAEAAAKAAKKAGLSGGGSSGSGGGSAIFGAIAGSGEVRYPLAVTATIGDGFGSRGGAHNGVDMLCPGGTAIGAIADGTVRISTESYFGYGVAVVIDHVINGKTVSTLYGHMTYGTRSVQVGQKVTAGQIIGQVGSTGRSTANHLHLEVKINGSLVDPMAWLRANGAA
ncbi:M23 family metallopeptidase [Labedella phragmitis]|uniref:M23 family metallopeptidase n=1 Tax=Labedella phragmitis TaxID=2498849 RepID=A0A3S3ZNP2_9MICO|nr:M23 family metallopeptidase [Labedella phragmitis]